MPAAAPDTPQPDAPRHATEQQARVAAVIYDMLLRGGPQAEQLSAPLSAAYPAAASVARQYAAYARAVTVPTATTAVSAPAASPAPAGGAAVGGTREPPVTRTAYGAEFEVRRGEFVLRRINVSSFAFFCCFSGGLLASVRVLFIFGLALSSALASAWEHEELHMMLDEFAVSALGNGPRHEAYSWVYSLMNEETLNEFYAADSPSALMTTVSTPSMLVVAILLTPITSGLLFFCLGALCAFCVNVALKVAGGIRLQDHED